MRTWTRSRTPRPAAWRRSRSTALRSGTRSRPAREARATRSSGPSTTRSATRRSGASCSAAPAPRSPPVAISPATCAVRRSRSTSDFFEEADAFHQRVRGVAAPGRRRGARRLPRRRPASSSACCDFVVASEERAVRCARGPHRSRRRRAARPDRRAPVGEVPHPHRRADRREPGARELGLVLSVEPDDELLARARDAGEPSHAAATRGGRCSTSARSTRSPTQSGEAAGRAASLAHDAVTLEPQWPRDGARRSHVPGDHRHRGCRRHEERARAAQYDTSWLPRSRTESESHHATRRQGRTRVRVHARDRSIDRADVRGGGRQGRGDRSHRRAWSEGRRPHHRGWRRGGVLPARRHPGAERRLRHGRGRRPLRLADHARQQRRAPTVEVGQQHQAARRRHDRRVEPDPAQRAHRQRVLELQVRDPPSRSRRAEARSSTSRPGSR